MKRFRLQFGLRGLLVGATLVGVGLGYLAARMQAGSRQAALEAALAARGAIVYFENPHASWLPANWMARLGWRVPVVVVGPTIDDEGLQLIGQLHGLRTLRLEGTKITDAGLARLRGLSTVEYLDLAQTGVGDEGLKSVAALSSLTTLKLNETQVGDAGIMHLANLEKLATLEIDGSRATHAGCLQAFVDVQGRTVVEGLALLGLAQKGSEEIWSIGLAGPHDTPRLIHYLQAVPGLESISLAAPYPGLEVLDELRHLPRLKSIWISDSTFDSQTAAALAKLPLDELHIQGMQWTNDSVRAFAHLRRATRIDLSSSAVTDEGLAHLRNLQGVTTLRLYGLGVGDEGLRHAACLKGLQTLDLSATKVSDAGMVHLLELPALEFLQLNDTKVTDQGLESLRAHPRLKGVAAEQTAISAAAKEAFRTSRPDREEWDPYSIPY